MNIKRNGDMGIHIEKLSTDNRCHFIDFFRRNDIDETRRNFHPFDFSEEALKKVFNSISKDLFFGVFNQKNEMIGFGMLRGWDECYDVPYLGVLIAEEMRGRGIGSRLIRYLIEVARKNKAKSVKLSVYEDNKEAMKIYRRCGFKTTEVQEYLGRRKWIMSRDDL